MRKLIANKLSFEYSDTDIHLTPSLEQLINQTFAATLNIDEFRSRIDEDVGKALTVLNFISQQI